jgi:superfamily I DNA/RNA helicase
MLSSEQLRAIAAIEDALDTANEVALEAPAGSGKTTVVCALAERLQAQVLTFTRKAAAELRERGCDASTIYRLAAENTDNETLGRTVTEDTERIVMSRWADKQRLTPQAALALWPAHGPALIHCEAWLDNLSIRVPFVIVDEAQDCTAAEVAAIRATGKRIVWVLDPWQRIYEWRGAVGIDCPAVVRLTTNFRSTGQIVDRAAQISGRPEKADPRSEQDGKTAWLCRSNIDARLIAEATGGHLVAGHDRRLLALVAIEAAAELGADWALAYRVQPSWQATKDAYGWRLPGVDMWNPRAFLIWQATHDLQDQLTDAPVQVMTIHAAKGLQFEHVRVVGWPAMAKPGEDQRLLYVAVTRATDDLIEYPSLALAIAGGAR